MTIPTNWLVRPATLQEVEERLAVAWAPDLWLEQWRRFASHVGSDDELWEYFALELAEPSSASEGWDLAEPRVGYALVRGGEVVEAISTAWL